MCGLAGFLRIDGNIADQTIVNKMLDVQKYRGPDDRGIWSQNNVALGLDRLSIIDLSILGHQPFTTSNNSSTLAYNGEVYNWKELRNELECLGVVFTSHCDTEVVLYALDHWGPEKALPKFNGMFALAWFNSENQELWLARDRTGIKPLYYAKTPSAIVFASEAKSIFAYPGVKKNPDVHSLITQIYLERLAGGWTAFEGVRKVLPGSALRISKNQIEEFIWFDIARDVDVDRILKSRNEPFKNQVSEFHNLLEQSVESHLQSDAPLAVMCSGGLDSSLTTAIARQMKPNLVAFVADVEDAYVPEAEKAQQVAEHLGIELRRIPVTVKEYPRLWAKAALHNDDPMYFYQNPMTLKVSEAVNEEGFKVLVTGEGADELFGGYPWQAEVGSMWRLRSWFSRIFPDIGPFRSLGRLLQASAPFDLDALRLEPFERRSQLSKAPPAAELIIDAGMRRNNARLLFEKLSAIPEIGERAFLARSFHDLYYHLTTLLSSNDKMTMATSVEMRVPFLENKLIDFALHLAPEYKLGKKKSKRVVKAAAEKYLPMNIVHATKVGFAASDKFWVGYEDLLRGGFVHSLFKWGDADQERINRILRGNPLLSQKLISMELWGQMQFNGKSSESMEDKLRTIKQ